MLCWVRVPCLGRGKLRVVRIGVRDNNMVPNCLRRLTSRPSSSRQLASMSRLAAKTQWWSGKRLASSRGWSIMPVRRQ